MTSKVAIITVTIMAMYTVKVRKRMVTSTVTVISPHCMVPKSIKNWLMRLREKIMIHHFIRYNLAKMKL